MKIFKKFSAWAAILALAAGLVIVPGQIVQAAPIPVYIDTEQVVFDVYPVVTDSGRVLVGLRGVFEAFGSDVYWNGDLQKITSTNGDIPLEFAVGSKTYWIDGKAYESDTAPQIVGSRVFVPLRLIAECYQAAVYWNGDMQAVFIYSQDYEPKATNSEESEPNNSLSTANRLYPEQKMSAKFGDYTDIDCFRLWIHEAGKYTITVDGTASNQQPAFELFDGNENKLASSQEYTVNIQKASLDLPVGYCYIRVTKLIERVDTIPYTLQAQKSL